MSSIKRVESRDGSSRDGSNPKDLIPAQHAVVHSGKGQTATLEGVLKKRGARMHRWSTRYVILSGSKLSYKVKKEDSQLRGSFDLVPGCILTEVETSFLIIGFYLLSVPMLCCVVHRFKKKRK